MIFKNEKVVCTRFLAYYLSPIIAQMASSDYFDKIDIKCDYLDGAIEFILDFMSGEDKENENCILYANILYDIGNSAVARKIVGKYASIETIEKALQKIEVLSKQGIQFQAFADLIADKIGQLMQDSLNRVPISIIIPIMESSLLNPLDYNLLINIVVDKTKALSFDHQRLLKSFEYQYLNRASIIKILSSYPKELIPKSCYESIGNRVCSDVDVTQLNPKLKHVTTKTEIYNKNQGLLYHIIQNLGQSGSIVVSASSRTTHDPSCLIYWKNNEQWVSEDYAQSWIMVELNGYLIKPTNYTLKAHNGPSFPKNWKLEAKDTNGGWNEISNITNSELLSSSNSESIFSCSEGFFSVFKFTQTSTSSKGDNIFCLRGFELFGSLYQS